MFKKLFNIILRHKITCMNKIKALLLLVAFLTTNHGGYAQTYDTLTNFGSYWRYDTANLDGTTWKTLTYADASWNCGPAPLGYGDTWIMTCIPAGCATQTNCYLPSGCSVQATDYFRRKVNVANTSLYDSVLIYGLIDDGMVLYVNGTLQWNYGLPTTYDHTTWSTNNVSSGAETTLVKTMLPISAFTNGDNQLAVELHQRAANTSDATMDMMLLFHKKSTGGGGGSHASVNLLEPLTELTIYPNPSTNSFTIEDKSGSNEQFVLSVYDMTGRCVSQMNGQFSSGKTEIRHGLNNGTYVVRMVGQNVNSSFTIQVKK